MTTKTRTKAQQRIFDEGVADARARRRPTPPEGPLADHYTAGFDSVPAPTTPAPTTSSKARSKRPAPASRAKRSPAPRRRAPARARRVRRKVSNNVVAPIEAQVVSGLTVLASAMAIAFLFNLLRNADTAAAVIGRFAAAVQWLDSTDPIRYRTN